MKHVIIGASAAGLNAARKIRSLRPEDEIFVISAENSIYSRCLLHHLISGDRTVETMNFVAPDFFPQNRIQWLKGTPVQSLDTARKQVTLQTGDTVNYDTLLIATGSLATIPPIPNLRTANAVFVLRNLSDAKALAHGARAGIAAVVIGGGLVGLDAAVGLAAKGVRVSVVEMAHHILPLQLDKKSAAKYEALCGQQGIDIYTGQSVQEVLLTQANDVLGVKLSDNRILDASVLVVAAGVRPNIDWINDPAIKLCKGIIIDDHCRTTADSVFAAGDATGKTGIWPQAVKQGLTAAANMCGQKKVIADNFNLKNSLNFFGLKTVSLGVPEAPDDTYDVEIYETPTVYKKIIHKGGTVYGAIFQGDINYSGIWTGIIGHPLSIPPIGAKDIFDIDYSDFYKMTPDGQYCY